MYGSRLAWISVGGGNLTLFWCGDIALHEVCNSIINLGKTLYIIDRHPIIAMLYHNGGLVRFKTQREKPGSDDFRPVV